MALSHGQTRSYNLIETQNIRILYIRDVIDKKNNIIEKE